MHPLFVYIEHVNTNIQFKFVVVDLLKNNYRETLMCMPQLILTGKTPLRTYKSHVRTMFNLLAYNYELTKS